MKKTALRSTLLLIGMACFLPALLFSLFNILFFPYARGLHNMTSPRLYILYAAYLGALIAVSRLLNRADSSALHRCAAWLVPSFVLASFSLMLTGGVLLAHEPGCDNAFVFQGAKLISIYGGITPKLDESAYYYLLHFPNQWGFTLLLSLVPFHVLLASIGKTGILYLLSGVQALLYAVAFLTLLLTVRKRFGIRAQLMLLFCLATFLPHYSAAAVLYTDTCSMPFVLLTLCCMLHMDQQASRRQIVLLSIGCGFALLIGSMMKMTCLILFFAAVIVWLLTLHPKRAAVCILIPLLIFAGGTKAVNHHMANHILNPEDASRYKTPLLHWIMMSIPTENNRYGSNTGDYFYTWELMAQGASHEEVMQSIVSRMHERLTAYRSIKDVIYAAICKNANSIGDGTFGMWEMLDDSPLHETPLSSVVLYDGEHYPLYADLCGGIWMAHMTCAILIGLRHIKKRRVCLAIPMIAFLGLMIFELFWEARSRYLFNFAPLMLFISACGMVHQESCTACQSAEKSML